MKRIYLEALTLHNFKGIKDLSLTFNPGENFIHGANGTGKTTIFDAFNWLLFGKNSFNQTVFEVKTIDKKTNKVIHKLSHEVEGVLRFDERTITLKKSLSEKWTKKRGAAVEELTGHETKYFIDGVPKSANEFKLAVDLIIQEAISRTITDPMYFNTVVPWKERREILFKLANVKSDQELCFMNPDMKIAEAISKILNSGKTIEDEKKRIAIEKKRLNDQIEEIPSRIDELQRSKAELESFEIEAFENRNENVLKINARKNELQDQLTSGAVDVSNERKELNELNVQLNEYESKLQDLLRFESSRQNQARANWNEEKRSIEEKIIELKRLAWTNKNEREEVVRNLENSESKLSDLRKQHEEELSRVYQSNIESVCPCCKRPEDPSKIEALNNEAKRQFEEQKTKRVSEIIAEGKQKKDSVALLVERKQLLETEFESLSILLKSEEGKLEQLGFEPEIQIVLSVDSDEYRITEAAIQTTKQRIQDVQEQIKQKLSENNEEAKQLIKDEIGKEEFKLQELNRIVLKVESNQKTNARIEELQANLKNLNQEKSNLEQTEIQIENFVRWKIEKVEDLINDSFEFCTFKLFEEQLNGGFAETCVCTIDGVPFNDLNTATKYKAGLDVIKTLQKWFNISAPIFIDGRESITELQNMDSQLINLIVDSTCKQLTQR